MRKTFIYFGGPGKLDANPDVAIKGGNTMVMGDLNGDGRKDLVIWLSGYGYGIDTVLVYFGKQPSPLALDTIPGLILTGEVVECQFGASMATGDLNNDGFDDLVISARYFNYLRGKVYIYLGKKRLSGLPDYVAIGDSANVGYGYIVQIDDINGDRWVDLLISSDDRGGFSMIDIFYGREEFTFTKNTFNQRLNSRLVSNGTYLYLARLVDLNSDVIKDLYFSHPQGKEGYAFLGNKDSIRWIPDLIYPNPDPTFFTRMSPYAHDIGDFNGDGIKDYVLYASIGAPCALVYIGKSSQPTKPYGVRTIVGLQYIAGVGDVNGDGADDFGMTVPTDALDRGYFVIISGEKGVSEVSHEENAYPRNYSLRQNFPNPFNPSTTIEYSLKSREKVSLVIYDTLGKEIRNLVEQIKDAGKHRVIWDGRDARGSNVPSGVYFYKLIVGSQTMIPKKAILIK
ncbi:MAG: T9SS type A sorting domain-containing protein [bacterium]